MKLSNTVKRTTKRNTAFSFFFPSLFTQCIGWYRCISTVISLNEFNLCLRVCACLCVCGCATKSAVDLKGVSPPPVRGGVTWPRLHERVCMKNKQTVTRGCQEACNLFEFIVLYGLWPCRCSSVTRTSLLYPWFSARVRVYLQSLANLFKDPLTSPPGGESLVLGVVRGCSLLFIISLKRVTEPSTFSAPQKSHSSL